MSFAFNFNVIEHNEETQVEANEIRETDGSASKITEGKDYEEIQIDWTSLRSALPESTEQVSLSDDTSLRVIDSSKVSVSEDSDVAQAAHNNSDLVPHVYEGGLKIWECSVDLARYLSSLQIAYRGLRVLELGCGAALPGLVGYSRGAEVTLQDYNSEVLSLITAPNVLLNPATSNPATSDPDSGAPSLCTLIAGDWAKVQKTLCDKCVKFDLVLTSETIYSRDSYEKLHDIMAALLAPSGTVYLAAKTYYFGVGGGIRDFEAYLDKRGVFTHEVCQEYTKGVQREILKLKFLHAEEL